MWPENCYTIATDFAAVARLAEVAVTSWALGRVEWRVVAI
ncbi:hypothetical protein LG3211_0259 [Lysobacter gummosus]|nr:hypothetical protein LG3211_0259 [Lysobacter gummosus]